MLALQSVLHTRASSSRDISLVRVLLYTMARARAPSGARAAGAHVTCAALVLLLRGQHARARAEVAQGTRAADSLLTEGTPGLAVASLFSAVGIS